ncbi:MAG: transcription antitermination factor NusB [Deltaproteobacteria bacterium]|nr:transcription antitermination factor NusB [Deltaproteobacteria bacterium]
MGHRRQARECALQILYEVDMASTSVEEVVRLFWDAHPVTPDIQQFAESLVRGTLQEREALDAMIAEHSAHWRVPRMAVVDRNILRMAAYELMHCQDVPIRVTLNEAIEIGKRYGSEESGAFINGILDQVAKQVDKPME